MGCAASGAQDAHGFASAMQGGYMPDVDTITYQGVFNEHLFDAGEQEKDRAVATQCFPIIDDGTPWLAVFLKSMFDGQPRDDTPIDLSVVIDISGSMGGQMSAGSHEGPFDSRLEHAKRGVEWIIKEALRSDDGIAVSSFNSDGHHVQPLTRRGGMDEEAFLGPVRDLRVEGGTILSSGMKLGRELLGIDFSEKRHRRILFLTDMGEMNAMELGTLIENNAADGVYVSIVAMGAEFNASLTEAVTKHRGSNYFCATNNQQLRECLVDDFAFNMFPSAFDINVDVCSGSLEVAGVYGTPFDTKEVEDLVVNWTPTTDHLYKPLSRSSASHLQTYSRAIQLPLPEGVIGNVIDHLEPPVTSVTEVNTMFPSRIESTGAMKGGLILIRLRHRTKACSEHPVHVKLTYTDAMGQAFTQVEDVVIASPAKNCMDEQYGATLAKGLMLQRYVQVCREHMELANLDDMTIRQAALPGLTASLNQFKCGAETTFKDDEKMQDVVSNFEDFVKVFSAPLQIEEALSPAISNGK